ncbi:MAG: efflux RND transporter permease subunit, partial [Fimbriimonadales bacterium]|nr:efflux RND transporter permease subunit [Fimbriimonadales bacterium]
VGVIGIIMLVGLVGKNAILLVDYTNTLRSRGLPREEALLQAGPTRLRPILMTTLALVLAMVPVALALGRGSEFRAPLGIVIIGGLTLSTLLTLFVIPASYTIFDDLSRWFGRMILRRPQEPVEDKVEERTPVGSRKDGSPSE